MKSRMRLGRANAKRVSDAYTKDDALDDEKREKGREERDKEREREKIRVTYQRRATRSPARTQVLSEKRNKWEKERSAYTGKETCVNEKKR